MKGWKMLLVHTEFDLEAKLIRSVGSSGVLRNMNLNTNLAPSSDRDVEDVPEYEEFYLRAKCTKPYSRRREHNSRTKSENY